MLIVTAVNKSDLAEVSDYEVWIGINQHRIWGGMVTNHLRSNGAAALLRKVADAMEEKQHDEVKDKTIDFFADYFGVEDSGGTAKRPNGPKVRKRSSKS